MKKQETISMTQDDLNRLHIIRLVIQRAFKQRRAAGLLDLSIRQVQRIAKEVKRQGPKGIIHKLRGKPSNHKHPEELKQKVIKLYKAKYGDFGPTLAREKLAERDKTEIGLETLRRWLMEAGLWERQRKVDQHRKWREPKASFGEMTQVDGSHHDWLEGRGPWLVLMGYIDDATSNVFARFYDYEGTLPAFESFYRYTIKYGLPQSVYIDCHSTYRQNYKLTLKDELEGKTKRKSQFERALEQLGVRVIHALSPQAKGRIERLFRTFQDRLVKEMRLEGIKTKEEANEFLKQFLRDYNRRFRREAKEKVNLHQPVPQRLDLKSVLSIQTKRTLRNDNTIRHEGKLYQITEHWKYKRPKTILVTDRIDGTRYLLDGTRKLHYHEITERPKLKPALKVPQKLRPPVIPKPTHPWRKTYQPEKEGIAA